MKENPHNTALEDLGVRIARKIDEATVATQAGIAETVGSIMLRGARPVPVFANTPQLSHSAGTFVGWAIRETSGVNPALVYLLDGADDAGIVIVPIALAPGESTRDWFGDSGINFGERGLRLRIAAGAIEGAVFLRGPS